MAPRFVVEGLCSERASSDVYHILSIEISGLTSLSPLKKYSAHLTTQCSTLISSYLFPSCGQKIDLVLVVAFPCVSYPGEGIFSHETLTVNEANLAASPIDRSSFPSVCVVFRYECTDAVDRVLLNTTTGMTNRVTGTKGRKEQNRG